MISNIEILKQELTERKNGAVWKTASEIAVKHQRNRRNIIDVIKQLEEVGFIKVDGIGNWSIN